MPGAAGGVYALATVRISELPRAHGADRAQAGARGEILLTCPAPKAWTARRERTQTRPEYPGTAVEWEGRIFEVLRADPTPEGGMRYRLGPWEEGHAIRRLERYDAESEQARAREQDDRRGAVRKRRLSILFAPLAGLLPGQIQKRMESEFGAPSLAMTVASALPLFVAGFLGLFAQLLRGLGGAMDFPAWIAPPPAIAAYLFAESCLRLASAVAGGEPMGSLPVVLAFEAWGTATGTRKPATPAVAPPDTAQAARDRFRMLEPALSFLSAPEQEVLRTRFGFDPIRTGRRTAILVLVVSGLNALVSFPTGSGGQVAVEWIWLLPSLYLLAEQILRLVRLGRGELSGSALGWIVRPFAKPLLAEDARRR